MLQKVRGKTILVTGAAGFIGSTFVECAVAQDHRVVAFDALTYAGRKENLDFVADKIEFAVGNICDTEAVTKIFNQYKFDAVFNFAAESHVDRSIAAPMVFLETNVLGVGTLLEGAMRTWETRSVQERESFRFIQISTDEVFGSLGDKGYFSELSPHSPNSPYSASKAAGDHLANAWFATYGLPVIVTNCSNNYGPRQNTEKLIPHVIKCALQEKPLPIYGNGKNVRDWIHVEDHCAGVLLALERGKPGEKYCFGGRSERQNLDVVRAICTALDSLRPRRVGSYHELISFVEDRKGHDWRYAIDDSKSERELGFQRKYQKFEDGLHQTIRWYLENGAWMESAPSK